MGKMHSIRTKKPILFEGAFLALKNTVQHLKTTIKA